jgi:hypothetical protein
MTPSPSRGRLSLSRFTHFLKETVMTNNLLTRIAASVALATASMTASAGVIDFTSSAWSSANGQGSFTSDGVTLSACLAATIPACAQTLGYPQLTYSAIYGVGIRSTPIDGNPDEIGRGIAVTEILKVSFSAPASLTQLQFRKFGVDTGLFGGQTAEVVGVSYNGGGFTEYTANGSDPFSASYVTGGVNYLYIKGVNVGSEASLLNITTANVPVPATLPLIGLGLAAFGGLSLRRRAV